jgi:phosphate acetyltransferase
MSVQAANVGDGRPNSKYDRLIAAAKAIPPAATLVVQPCDESSLRGTVEASEAGLITPTLVGPTPKIRDVASKHGIDISRFEIVNAPHSEAAAARAVELIHEAKGEDADERQPSYRRVDT